MTDKETPEQAVARLTAENADLKKQTEAIKVQQAKTSADEILVGTKIAHGLTRNQAISVIKHQEAHDQHEAALARAAAEKKAAGNPAATAKK